MRQQSVVDHGLIARDSNRRRETCQCSECARSADSLLGHHQKERDAGSGRHRRQHFTAACGVGRTAEEKEGDIRAKREGEVVERPIEVSRKGFQRCGRIGRSASESAACGNGLP